MWTPRRFAIAFLAGAAGGLAGDYFCHVRTGVLSYPDPGPWGQPWWVGPQFGAWLLVLLTAAGPFAAVASRRVALRMPRDAITGAIWFAAAYGVTGLFRDHPRALLAGMLVAFAARLAVREDRVPLLAWSLLVAAGGVAWEALISGLGLFHYAQPDLVGVPIWLPAIYLHGAPLAFPLVRGMRSAPATSP
jgi:hypothetical protein